MDLTPCNGCTACSLRCAAGVPLDGAEFNAVQEYLADTSQEVRSAIEQIAAQDKTVDLGDGVTVQMCRYHDQTTGLCAIYPVRPLICRLFGAVEWLPCPIEKVENYAATPDALALMQEYAAHERRTFEGWEMPEAFPGMDRTEPHA